MNTLLLAEAAASETLLAVLLYLVLGVLVAAGVGAAVATVRVVLPGLAGAADRALEATGGRQLLLMGVLPLMGVGLLGQAAASADQPTFTRIFAVGVVVPAALLVLLGLLAALPHLGQRLLEGPRTSESARPRSALARAVGGGIALGLAATTAWLPPLFAVLALLVGGWLLGIGLSTLVGRRRAPPTAA
jgi:hypothetical protein